MQTINFDEAIRLHNAWRRQFMNAFAAGSYADMPLSDHRGCMLALALAKAKGPATELPQFKQLVATHDRFHAVANDIQELSANGAAASADLMLPELADLSHRLGSLLDEFRAIQREG